MQRDQAGNVPESPVSESPIPVSAPPPFSLEGVRQEIRATERTAGVLLVLAVALLLFVLHETHEELKEGEVPPIDLWTAFAAVGVCMIAVAGACAVLLVPGAGGLGLAVPPPEGLSENEVAQQDAGLMRGAARRKRRLLTGTVWCLLAALLVTAFVYVKGFWLPHVTFDRGAQAA